MRALFASCYNPPMQDIHYAVAHRNLDEIKSFSSRYEDFKDNLIPDLFRSSLRLTVESWKPSDSWGSSHVIYLVKTKEKGQLILRANTGFNKDPEYVMLVEQLITNRVADVGVPTNNLLFVDITRKQFPFDYQIQEVLIGNDPEIDFSGTQEDYDQISFELGVNVAKYHQIKLPGYGRFDSKESSSGKLIGTKDNFYDYLITSLNDDLSALVDSKHLNEKQAKLITALFSDNEELVNIKQGVLLHYDLADHNIMYIDNHLTGIFDWEAAVIGDPVLDLASCPTWGTLYPRTDKLLEGYKTLSKLPDHFQEKWDIYTLRTIIWKTIYCLRMDILNPKRLARLATALKPFDI